MHSALRIYRPLRALLSLVAVLVVLGALERSALAFPWLIRHDYKVCNTCHADPSGAGLLTAYGRGMEETIVRMHYGKHAADEDPGKVGNFMFGAFDLPESLLLQADVRSLLLADATKSFGRSPFLSDGNPRFYLMQANVAGQLKLGRVRFNGDLGLGYPGGALGASITSGEYRLISRQFWAGADLGGDEQFLLRAGRINLPFGLRIIEHTSFVRSATRTDINASQQYGVSLAYTGEKFRGEIMAIAGNFNEHPDQYRDRGYAGYLEYTLSDNATAGASSMVTHASNDPLLGGGLFRHAHGAFARWVPAKPLVVMAESDLLLFSQAASSSTTQPSNTVGNATFVQLDYEPTQGFHVMPAAELLNASALVKGTTLSGTVAATWFFAPHADMRLDAVFTDTGLGTGSPSTSIKLLGQLHFVL